MTDPDIECIDSDLHRRYIKTGRSFCVFCENRFLSFGEPSRNGTAHNAVSVKAECGQCKSMWFEMYYRTWVRIIDTPVPPVGVIYPYREVDVVNIGINNQPTPLEEMVRSFDRRRDFLCLVCGAANVDDTTCRFVTPLKIMTASHCRHCHTRWREIFAMHSLVPVSPPSPARVVSAIYRRELLSDVNQI